MIEVKIKCKCGKVLRVPKSLADKKVACPACKKAYRVAADKFTVTPPAVLPSPPKEPVVELELSSIDPTSSPSELNLLEGIELMPPSGPVCPGCKQPQPAGAKICVRCGIDLVSGKSVLQRDKDMPVELGYAAKGNRPLKGRAGLDAISGPKRGFWADLALAFIFPFATLHNAVGSLVLLAVNGIAPFFCFGMIIDVYMVAVYMKVVSDTASGRDDFNAASFEGGIWDDFIMPALSFVGAFLLSMSPGILYTMLVLAGVMQPNSILLFIWYGFGILMWPMFILLASLSQWALLLRSDLIVVTMARTILPYLSICAALAIALGMYSLSSYGQDFLMRFGIQSNSLAASILGAMGAAIFGRIVYAYFMIVAMRIIGLYYLHQKRKFAFKLE